MEERPPNVYIVAGPNGAGKSTFARLFLPDYADCKEFVNADLIAAGLSPFNPESLAIEAGRLMLERIETLARSRVDFGFETTLAGRSQASLLTRLREKDIGCICFSCGSPIRRLALERVHDRVLVRRALSSLRRLFAADCKRGMSNFFHLYQQLLDSYLIFDNAGASPRLVALEIEEGRLIVLDWVTFDTIRAEAQSR